MTLWTHLGVDESVHVATQATLGICFNNNFSLVLFSSLAVACRYLAVSTSPVIIVYNALNSLLVNQSSRSSLAGITTYMHTNVAFYRTEVQHKTCGVSIS